ncbi:MAG: quinolinate synthase NadA [Eubacterium sp.]|nr:quinolinate synthase NadA [Eubacterium sp.]
MAKVILLCGTICSGKTRYAEGLISAGAVALSCDELMLRLYGEDVGDKFDELSARAMSYLHDRSVDVVRAGVDVVLDWGFWSEADRERTRKFYRDRGIDTELHYVKVSEETLHKNIADRNASGIGYHVDGGLLEKCLSRFQPPTDADIIYINRRDLPAGEIRRNTMTIQELQQEIIRLKKEKDICILAHSYQTREITEIADFTGDSFQLSVQAKGAQQSTVIMCGVRFMAETVKLLSPQKKVLLANPIAGCPMAEQMDKELISAVKEQYPDYTVVAYINTTTDLKTICDVCVTSSSAVKIVKELPDENILFIPDCNLGDFVQKQVPEKNIKLLQGGCPIHARVSANDVTKAKALHPDALVLVHPECTPDVLKHADFIGSTSAIMNYAEQSDAKEFIIGTEISIGQHLSYTCPDKRFYPLSKDLICPNMKATSLLDVYHAVCGDGGEEIFLDDDTISKARVCIDRMIELG